MNYLVLVPPPEAFKYRNKKGDQKSAMNAKTPEMLKEQLKGGGPDNVFYPPDGGMYVHYPNLKYPKEGIPYAEAMVAVDSVKGMIKMWMSSFNPFTWRRTLKYFSRAAHEMLAEHVLETRFRKRSVVAFGRIFATFVRELGISDEKLEEVAETVAEYEDAYFFIFQDLLNETTAESLSKKPVREVRRLAKLAVTRSPKLDEKKFLMAANLLSFVFLFPKVRRALRETLKMGFGHLQMNLLHQYFMLTKTYYDFGGLPYESRLQLFTQINGA